MAEVEAEFLADTLAALAKRQKSIPGKYLWDEVGSRLFERVCGSARYYVARRESLLLQQAAHEIARTVGWRRRGEQRHRHSPGDNNANKQCGACADANQIAVKQRETLSPSSFSPVR